MRLAAVRTAYLLRALDVAKGAFRFTTGVFSSPRRDRAVNVRIATITAGTRGTDLWGISNAERDLICLLEGRITVFHALDQSRELSEPLSFCVALKGAAPGPVLHAASPSECLFLAVPAVQVKDLLRGMLAVAITFLCR